MTVLHWFRNDLRIIDNQALIQAMQDADEVIALYIITPQTWRTHHAAAVKIAFIVENLHSLSMSLQQFGIPLLIKQTGNFAGCARLINQLCDEHHIKHVYFNEQVELDEKRRDEQVLRVCHKQQIHCHIFPDQLILPPGTVLTQQQRPYQVFTPFKKAWLAIADQQHIWQTLAPPHKKFKSHIKADPIPEKIRGFSNKISLNDWPAGENNAQQRLKIFCKTHLANYAKLRDVPSEQATSRLSPYLAQGVLSPRYCMQLALKYSQCNTLSKLASHTGTATWINELIWRDFYKHISYFFPRVCMNLPFKLNMQNIPWENNHKFYEAWCIGQTGFPIVDAAMRQLNQTGWMHNRLRMLCANFLSKILLIDWRWGERYFMEHLIDGDFSANNGGWQWSASTGTDAAPYFRIFNPWTQSQRFDPDATFMRCFCPELKRPTSKQINQLQQANSSFPIAYPTPIVDYKKRRLRYLALFKK